MRFHDFFISYKLGLKDIKNLIPFTKLPLYRKFAVIATFSLSILSLIMLFIGKLELAASIFLIAILLTSIFVIINSTKKNLFEMLSKHHKPYSSERMNMILNLLKQYNITEKETIDLLIEEAKEAQVQSDFLYPLKKPLKVLGTVIIPIVVYVAQKIGDSATQEQMITMALQVIIISILIFVLIIAIKQFVVELLYRDYNKYGELIYDLRQVKIFYSKESISSPNLNIKI